MTDTDLAEELLETMRATVSSGLNRGTTGNLSVRCPGGLLITPSGLAPAEMTVEDVVFMDMQGTCQGRQQPSSEWRFHRDILAQRKEFTAVLHTHSTFASILACLGKDVPAFHYMIAAAGGKTLPCTPYALMGSQELADAALAALQERRACLLGHHGLLAAGESLAAVLSLSLELEDLCRQYCHLLQIGPPRILSDQEMDRVLEKFKTYGKRG